MFRYYELMMMGRTREINRETAVCIWDKLTVQVAEDCAEIDYSNEHRTEDGLLVEYEED